MSKERREGALLLLLMMIVAVGGSRRQWIVEIRRMNEQTRGRWLTKVFHRVLCVSRRGGTMHMEQHE